MGLLLKLPQLCGEFVALLRKPGGVDEYTVAFHAREYRHQRQLQLPVYRLLRLVGVQPGLQLLVQPERQQRAAGRVGGGCRHLHLVKGNTLSTLTGHLRIDGSRCIQVAGAQGG